MLTKKLTFDEPTLQVLRAMTWSADGTLGTITGGQLERTLYTKVNKALDAMGGKWNRAKGGHLFPVDPRPQVEGLLSDGALVVERDGFFETPSAVAHQMIRMLGLQNGERVLEPSAGMGAIIRAIPETVSLTCVEKNKDRAKHIIKTFGVMCIDGDFLELGGQEFDAIAMNPPFEEGQDIDHVRHAYELLAPSGRMVSIMGEGAFFRNDKKATAFREWLELVEGVSEKLPEGTFKESGTGVNTRLVFIEK